LWEGRALHEKYVVERRRKNAVAAERVATASISGEDDDRNG
jgi:hypothetical protein